MQFGLRLIDTVFVHQVSHLRNEHKSRARKKEATNNYFYLFILLSCSCSCVRACVLCVHIVGEILKIAFQSDVDIWAVMIAAAIPIATYSQKNKINREILKEKCEEINEKMKKKIKKKCVVEMI